MYPGKGTELRFIHILTTWFRTKIAFIFHYQLSILKVIYSSVFDWGSIKQDTAQIQNNNIEAITY